MRQHSTEDLTARAAFARLRTDGGTFRADARRLLAVLTCTLVAFFSFAPAGQADAPRDVPGNARGYRLAPGDRLTIVVHGQAELSGEFVVDDGGGIELPLAGPIEVKDLTVSESQRRIAERLADGVLSHPSVSVRLSEARPIYVLGDVRVPGSYSFRYSATVKSAVALAGGYGLAGLTPGAAFFDFLAAEERVRQLSYQRLALLVRRARIEAQRDRAAVFVLRDISISATTENGEIADVIAFETETFNSQTASLQNQLSLLRTQKPRLQNEIESLNMQLGMAKKQQSLVKERVQEYDRLVQKQLGRRSTQLELTLDEARQESDIWRLSAEFARLQIMSGELDLKINEAVSSFDRQVMSELLDVRQRLKELDVIMPTAREMREAKLVQSSSSTADEVTPTISITRVRGGQVTEFKAGETTFLEPGDIVEIKRPQPRGSWALNSVARSPANSPSRMGGTAFAKPLAPITRLIAK